MRMQWKCVLTTWSLVISAVASSSFAVEVRVTIENLSGPTGIAFSPLIASAHNGSVDLFNSGVAASSGVQNVAELGGVGATLINEVHTMQATAIAAPLANPDSTYTPLFPGAKQSVVLSLDPVNNRYFSFLSMAVPCNDLFIGNDSPTARELFDASGNFDAQNFTLTGSAIWDAGTEVNGLSGALFVNGQDGNARIPENGVVHAADLATSYSYYVGQTTPAGYVFSGGPGATTAIASISFSVVPEPASLSLMGLAAVGFIGMKFRRQVRH
ncbi:MAG TPA: spondin domain-containing protein [Lacipirellulaceae bacterium]|nr:spondin domain-containing protein [Lacipirellulaceae bacterium]